VQSFPNFTNNFNDLSFLNYNFQIKDWAQAISTRYKSKLHEYIIMHETNCQICEKVQLLFWKALHLVVAHDPNLQAIYYFSGIKKIKWNAKRNKNLSQVQIGQHHGNWGMFVPMNHWNYNTSNQ